jgi:hypothetical protein
MSHIRNTRIIALAAVLAAFAALPARAQEESPAAGDPCADSTYQALKARDAATLSDAEKQDLALRDLSCQAGGTVVIGRSPPFRASQFRMRRAPTTMGEGVDLYVFNLSTVPIIVESIRVYDCDEVRQVSCATHRPRTLIPPNQEKRVITIRYREGRERPARYEIDTRVTAVVEPGES